MATYNFLDSDPFEIEDPDFRKKFIAQSHGQGNPMEFDLKKTQDAFAIPKNVQTPNFIQSKPFNIEDSELYKRSQEAIMDDLSGKIPGWDEQSNIARETLKSAQAERVKNVREGLIGSGFRDTGKYLEEGILQPEAQRERERLEFERQLIANRAQMAGERKQAGLGAAKDLLGLLSGEKQAAADLNLREKQLAQDGMQFKDKLEFDKYALDKGYTEEEKQRAWQAIENERARQSTEKVAFADLNVREKALAQEGMNFKDKLAFDKYALEQGFTEAERERVWKSVESEKARQSTEKIAFADLNIREKELAQKGMQFDSRLSFDKYALEQGFTESEKDRVWKSIEAEKERVSREKIAQDEILIKQQGLTLEQARLYGYTDAAGNHVSGTAELAAKALGLQEKTLELQKQELFGYTDENGVYHKGKYDFMNEESKREADRLYGYQIKDENGNVIGTVAGELQLKSDQIEIEKQGLKLSEAKLFGYEKDTNGDGIPDTHVDGEMDLNMKKFGLEEKSYEDNRLKVFGGIDPVTGQIIKGEMQLAAEELGLKEKSFDLQKQELFGYTDENGVYHKGKYDLLTEEQKMQADQLYGYKDPKTGDWVPGKWEQVKDTLKLQLESDLKKLETQNGYDVAMQKLEGDLKLAMQQKDYEHTVVLQELKYKKEMEMQQKELDYKQAVLALEKQGVQMSWITEQIKNGNMDADTALEYMKKTFPQELVGILKPPDPNAWQQSLDEDFMMQQYQFAKTHGIDIKTAGKFDDKGNFLGLKDDYLQQFNDHLNNTIYGTDDSPSGQLISEFKLGDKDPVSYFSGKTSDDPAYQALLKDNSVIEFSAGTYETGDKPSTKRYVFTNMPSVGGFFKFGNTVYRLDSKRTRERSGTDKKEYTIINILTGKQTTLVATDNPTDQYIKEQLDKTKG